MRVLSASDRLRSEFPAPPSACSSDCALAHTLLSVPHCDQRFVVHTAPSMTQHARPARYGSPSDSTANRWDPDMETPRLRHRVWEGERQPRQGSSQAASPSLTQLRERSLQVWVAGGTCNPATIVWAPTMSDGTVATVTVLFSASRRPWQHQSHTPHWESRRVPDRPS